MSDFAINSAGHGHGGGSPPPPSSSVGPVNRLAHTPHLNGAANQVARLSEPETSARRVGAPASRDRVEVSDFARHLERLRQLPDVRFERIAHAREAIQTGAYDSDRVLDETIDLLADELVE